MAAESEQEGRRPGAWSAGVFLALGLVAVALLLFAYLYGPAGAARREIASMETESRVALAQVGTLMRKATSGTDLLDSIWIEYTTARALQRHYTVLDRSAFEEALSKQVASLPGAESLKISRSPAPIAFPPAPGKTRPAKPASPILQTIRARRRMRAELALGRSTPCSWQIKLLCKKSDLYRAIMQLDLLDLPGSVTRLRVADYAADPLYVSVTATYCVRELHDPTLAQQATAPPGAIAKIKDRLGPDLRRALSDAGGPDPRGIATDMIPPSRFGEVSVSRIICSKAFPEESIAVVKGRAVRAGDVIDGMTVVRITPEGLAVRRVGASANTNPKGGDEIDRARK